MNKLYVVGIGPGNYKSMTIHAAEILKSCDLIVGYTVYVDLIQKYFPDKEFLSTAMTKEVERCNIALQEAKKGRDVAMICSGDSGIYGMAALIYELRGESNDPEVVVVPGLTAACSGGALLGAPLTHDFAVVSLSDRLTEWKTIERRLRYAAQADFSLAIYNPCSKGRPDHLKKACDILMEYLPKDRICGVCHNIGRQGEYVELLTLEALKEADVDMFCTVFVGNEMCRNIGEKMVTPRGYRHG